MRPFLTTVFLLVGSVASAQTARDSVLAKAIRKDADSTLTHLRLGCTNNTVRQNDAGRRLCLDTLAQKRIIARTDSILTQFIPAQIVTTVVITLNTTTLVVGQTTQAFAIVRDQYNVVIPNPGPIAWTTAAPVVASVSLLGLVTAKGAGSTAVVGSLSGKSGSASITVTPLNPPIPTTADMACTFLPPSRIDSVRTLSTGKSTTWVTIGGVPFGYSGDTSRTYTFPADLCLP